MIPITTTESRLCLTPRNLVPDGGLKAIRFADGIGVVGGSLTTTILTLV